MKEAHSSSRSPAWFTTTHWTVVLATDSIDEERAGRAVSLLCETYRPAVHAFIATRGYSPQDKDDLTQQFFATFLEKRQYRAADPARGRFRSFLLGCVKNFLAKEHERASAQKRGGGTETVSLNETFEDGEARMELRDERTADKAYEHNWAISLLTRARSRLQAEYQSKAQTERFLLLEQFLPGEQSDCTYAEAAKRLGIPEGTVKSEVHRFKRQFGALVRLEVANTVGSASEVEEELLHLRAVLANAQG